MQGEESWFVLRGGPPRRRGYTVRRTTESAIEDWEGGAVGPSFRSESVAMEAVGQAFRIGFYRVLTRKVDCNRGWQAHSPRLGRRPLAGDTLGLEMEADKVRRGISRLSVRASAPVGQ
jgi:hypothetical protein